MAVSVILPVYNEGNRLESCVDRVEQYLAGTFPEHEIVIVEDNSTDDSYAVARRIAASCANVRLIHNPDRLGRGSSLREAIEVCRYDYVVYMDVDLATDLSYTKKLVDSLACGAAVATGSRLMKGSSISRPLVRDVASKSYNLLVRLLFRSRIHDHQCGFKGFSRGDVLPIIGIVQDNHWFWDTELLILCQKNGLSVHEFPVSWTHNGGNNLNVSKVRVLKDARNMASRLLKLKWRMMSGGGRAPVTGGTAVKNRGRRNG